LYVPILYFRITGKVGARWWKAERHHGRKTLIEKMMSSTSGSKRRKKEKDLKVRGGLALGYEVLEIRDEGDEGVSHFLSFLKKKEK
jgi:hypothetical protein